MCGITGIVVNDGAEVHEREISLFTGFLRHRGPDATGSWISKDRRIGLGHARLSILDASPAAGQPMVAPSGRHVMVFNGEVYNFLEIAQSLRTKGYTFRTRSDTEVLMHAWDCWGQEMFHRLNGMWALAIYDTVTGETTLCRDRFGVKPLYYHCAAGRFIFASEVQAIDRFLKGQLPLDAGYLQALSRLDASVGSYLDGVSALSPGCILTVEEKGRREERQWYSLSPVDVPGVFADQARALKLLAIDACRLRLRSDVPVATCLSGGVDSSSLVALLHEVPAGEARFPGFNHRSFTAAFPGTELDETDAARALAERYRIDLDIEVIESPGAAELEEALHAADGPMPTMAFYPIWKLYRHIRQQGVSVTLDGIGPDEILGGYYLGPQALEGAWHDSRPLWFFDLYKTYAAMHPDAPDWIRHDLRSVYNRRSGRLKRPVQSLLASLGLCHNLPPESVDALPNLPAGVPQDHSMRDNPLARALWRQFFVAPLPFFLHQYDRCSMASGVECRMPFMDYRIVEYLFSLPLKSLIGGGYTKRVLREAVRGIVPDVIRLKRHKIGFNAPFGDWLNGPLKEWVLDTSASCGFMQSSYFDGAKLSEQIRSASANQSPDIGGKKFWLALHTAWWVEHRRQLSLAA